MKGIICAGFGGQGVLTAGLILAKTGMDNGLNVTWIPSYGSEMRGGTANCNVKISDGKISSPFVKGIDILMAMNQPSVDKFQSMVNPGGLMVINSTLVADGPFRTDIRVASVNGTELAEKLGNPRGANIVMLGALAEASGLFQTEELMKGVEAFFEAKGKSAPKNRTCFEEGARNAVSVPVKE